MPYNLNLPDGSVLRDIPDDIPEVEAARIALEKFPELNVVLAGKQVEPGSLESWKDTVVGSITGIPANVRSGMAGVEYATRNRQTDYTTVVNTAQRPEDQEALAQRWYGKSLGELKAAHDLQEGTATTAPETQRRAAQYAAEARDKLPREMTLGQEVTSGIVSNLATNAPPILAAVALRSPALAGLGLGPAAGVAAPLALAGMAGLQTASEGAVSGKAPEDVTRAAVLNTAVEQQFEKLGFGVLEKLINNKTLPLWRRVLLAGLAESPQESLTEGTQQVISNVHFRPGDPFKDVGRSMAMAAVTAPFIGGGQFYLANKINDLLQKKGDKTTGEVLLETAPEDVKGVLQDLWATEERAKALDDLLRMGQVSQQEYAAEAGKMVQEVEAKLGTVTQPETSPITPPPSEEKVAAMEEAEKADLEALRPTLTPEQEAAKLAEIEAVKASLANTPGVPTEFAEEIETNTKELWARIQSGEKNLYTGESAPVVRAVGEALEAGKIASEQDVRNVVNSVVQAWKESELGAAEAFRREDLSPQAELFRKQNIHYFNPDELKSVIPPSVPEVARMQEEGVEPQSLEDKLRAALPQSSAPDQDLLTELADQRIAKMEATQSPDTSLSREAAANLIENYVPNPNNGKRLRELPVAWTNDDKVQAPVAVGNIQPGQVVVMGEPSAAFPAALVEAYGRHFDYLNRKFMGGKGKFVVLLKSPSNARQVQTSWHTKQGDVHIIQPSHGLMLDLKEENVGQPLSKYNSVRKAQIYLSSYHEFAHALLYDMLYSFIPERVMTYLESESNTWEAIPERYIEAIPNELIKNVVREYSAKKQELAQEGKTGLDFFEHWMSPAKLNNRWLKKFGIGHRENMGMAVANLAAYPAQWIVNRMEERSGNKMQILSFPEYIGEQMARWAYAGTSPLARGQRQTAFGKFFGGIWEGLRKYLQAVFVRAKRDNIIKPGVAFADWVESLTKVPAVTKAEIVGEGKTLEATETEITQVETVRKEKKVKKAEKVKEIRDREEKGITEQDLRKALGAAGIKPTDQEWKDVMEEFRAGDTAAAVTMLKEITGKPFRYDSPEARESLQKIVSLYGLGEVSEAGLSEEQAKDPRLMKHAGHLWRFQKFVSPFFADWFRKSVVVTPTGEPVPLLTDPGLVFVPEFASFMPLSKVEKLAAAFETPLPNYIPFAIPHGAALNSLELLVRRELNPRMEKEVAKREEKLGVLQTKRAKLELQLDKTLALNADQIGTSMDAVFNNELGVTVAEEKAWTGRFEGIEAQLKGRIAGLLAMEKQLRAEINAIVDNPLNRAESRRPLAVYARMENPLSVRLGVSLVSDVFQNEQLVRALREARLTGRDGVIIEDFPDGLGGTTRMFLPFERKQLKWDRALTFSNADNYHWDWDQGNIHQYTAAEVVAKARTVYKDTPLRRNFIRFNDTLHATLQLQQLAQLHPDLIGLQKVIGSGREYTRIISVQLDIANEVSEGVAALTPELRGTLYKTLMAEAEGGVHWATRQPIARGAAPVSMHGQELGSDALTQAWKEEFISSPEVEARFAARGIDLMDETGKLLLKNYLAIKNSLFMQMQLLEYVLKRRFFEKFPEDAIKVAREWTAIEARFAPLKATPFVPQQWFGKYVLSLREKNELGRWIVVHKEAWEDPKQYLERAEYWTRHKRADQELRKVIVSDKEQVLLALPEEFLYEAAQELQLTPEETQRLQELAQPLKYDKAIARVTANYGVTGASDDLHRLFSAYSWHQANFIAKMLYRPKFRSHVAELRTQMRLLERGDMPAKEKYMQVERVASIAREAQRAVDYLMSAEEELAEWRAVIATLFLIFNVKTALLNLYGLLTTLSDVTGKYGTVKGGAMFMRGMRYVASTAIRGDQAQGLELQVRKAIDRGIAEGVLSQNYAYMLAGQAIAPFWQRVVMRGLRTVDEATNSRVGYSLGRGGRALVDIGMKPFRFFELLSRRATFVVKYLEGLELYPPGPLDVTDKAYEHAVRGTEILQSDWSRLNKPRMFRGGTKLGVLAPLGTIFLSFAQHMAFHAYGGAQLGQNRLARMEGRSTQSWYAGYTMRIWLITLLMAGLKGLPGAENLADILNALWRIFTGRTAEHDLRERIKQVHQWNVPVLSMLTRDPSRILYGLGHDIAGFDISRSIGFGRMLPGTDVLTRPTDNPAALIGGTVSSLMGPAGTTVYWMARWMLDPTYSNFAKLPGGIGSVLQAFDWMEHGARGPQGNRLTMGEGGKARDLTATELVGRAAGFRPTAVSEAQEATFEAWDTKLYWQKQRQEVLDLGRMAYVMKNREGQADFKAAVKDYNSRVPKAFPELKISGKDISHAITQKLRRVQMLERGIEPDKRYRRLVGETMRSFSPTSEEEDQ